jgi:hypothetical protein
MATHRGASSVQTEEASGWEELLAAVHRERATCVERTLNYMGTMPTYGKLTPEELRLGVRANFDAVLAGMKHRRLPGAPDDTKIFEGRGAVRARQGLPVTEMLAAWRAGQESLYLLARDFAPDVPDRDALLLEFLEMVIAWADFAMLAAADGHRRSELSRAREQHHAQSNLVRRLLAGTVAPGEVRMAVAPLGLDPTAVYQAVRARPEPSVDGETIEQYLGADGLVNRGRGLVVWIDGDICGFIADLPKAAAPTAIGISAPEPLHDLEPAFRRASRALETALALGVRGVFDLKTLGVQAAVVGDADVGDAMVQRYIGALHDLTGGDVILHTTERFLTNDCNAEATARELDVHVNTVRHRLNRFEEATGRSLRETEALVEVWWALQRQHLS